METLAFDVAQGIIVLATGVLVLQRGFTAIGDAYETLSEHELYYLLGILSVFTMVCQVGIGQLMNFIAGV